MSEQVKRRRRRGDRYDGRRLKTLDPFSSVVPFIMTRKTASSNIFKGSIQIDTAEKYCRELRMKGYPGLGVLHMFIATYIRIVSQRPALNRFISGQRIFTRDDEILVSLVVKKELTIEGAESVIKVKFRPDDTIFDVYNKMNKEIEKVKTEDEAGTDAIARMLNYAPRILLRFIVSFIKCLDYCGVMPKALNEASPFHGSMFISDLGSVRLPPVSHHLYDFGNLPMFICFGRKERRAELTREGEVERHKYVDYSVVIDERICDGFYFSDVLRMFDWYFKNPKELSAPPERVIRDID